LRPARIPARPPTLELLTCFSKDPLAERADLDPMAASGNRGPCDQGDSVAKSYFSTAPIGGTERRNYRLWRLAFSRSPVKE